MISNFVIYCRFSFYSVLKNIFNLISTLFLRMCFLLKYFYYKYSLKIWINIVETVVKYLNQIPNLNYLILFDNIIKPISNIYYDVKLIIMKELSQNKIFP